jgi:hypothetical protein
MPFPPVWLPKLPLTLEGGHARQWWIPCAKMPAEEDMFVDDKVKLRGFVGLGTGKQAVAKKQLVLDRSTVERARASKYVWPA